MGSAGSPNRLVSITIVTFDPPPGMLEDCVRSVLSTIDRDTVEVIVVDTGGAAAGRLAAADLGDGIEVVDLGANLGFAAGLRAGFERGLSRGAEVVVGLNDDVVVDDGWMEPLVAALAADERLAAVQPLLVQLDADRPVVNSAGVELDRYGAGRDRRRNDPPADIESGRVPAVTGGAAAWAARFVRQIGMPDTRFFLYYEDVEWCRRGARAGWEFGLVVESTVRHAGSASTVALGDGVRRLQERNRLWTVAMHGGPGEMARALWLSIRRLRHEPRAVHRAALAGGAAGGVRRLAERLVRRDAAARSVPSGPPSFVSVGPSRS